MKNSWIFSAVLELVVLAVTLTVVPAMAAQRKQLEPLDLTNFALSPEYSRWIVGPIAHIATAKEIDQYLALQSDDEAAAFIEDFWDRRGGEALFPVKGKKLIFDERVKEADKFFTEGTYVGSRTARGTILVLYGAPLEVRYELPVRPRDEAIEVWVYPADAPEGLDGEKPDPIYRFVKEDDVTVLYRGPTRRQFGGA